MAFVSGDQGSGLLGRFATAIGNSKPPNLKHVALSPQGDSAYSGLFEDYNKLLGNQTAGLSDFTSQYKALTPQLAGLDQLHASTLGDLVTKALNFNPTKYLQDSGNYLFGQADRYLKQGMDAGNAALKQNLAAGGYGDRAPGGYSALLNANRVTSNLLPLVSNIVSNLTPLTNQQNSTYLQNLAQIPNLQLAQSNALQGSPYRALVPAGVQQDLLRGNLGTVNDLVKNQLNNWSFYVKPNAWQTAGNVLSGIYGGIFDAADAANKVASAYGNVMTSGLGGMGGGMGGAEAPTSYPQSTGLGAVQPQGMGTGEGYPLSSNSLIPSASLYQPSVYQQPVSSIYPQISPQYPSGYGAYSPYGLSAYGYSPQNPYAQYGAYF